MRITVNPRELRAALSTVRRHIPARPRLPILSCVRLAAVGADRLTISGTDLESHCTVTVPAMLDGSEEFIVPARALDSALRLFTGRAVVTVTSGTSKAGAKLVEVASGNDTVTIPFDLTADLPYPPTLSDAGQSLTLSGATLRDAVSAVLKAAAPDYTRPVLAHLSVEAADGTLRLVAADGFRLAVQTVHGMFGPFAALVLVRPLAAVLRAVNADDTVTLTACAESITKTAKVRNGVGKVVETMTETYDMPRIRITTDRGVSWVLRQHDGAFPDWRRIIPQASTTVVSVDAADLTRAARFAVETGREDRVMDKLGFMVEANGDDLAVRLEAGVLSRFAPSATFAAGTATGEPLRAVVQARLLLDFLVGARGTVTICLTTPTAPAIVRREDRTETMYLVMPMYAV